MQLTQVSNKEASKLVGKYVLEFEDGFSLNRLSSIGNKSDYWEVVWTEQWKEDEEWVDCECLISGAVDPLEALEWARRHAKLVRKGLVHPVDKGGSGCGDDGHPNPKRNACQNCGDEL